MHHFNDREMTLCVSCPRKVLSPKVSPLLGDDPTKLGRAQDDR
jgi:hypothetical protein